MRALLVLAAALVLACCATPSRIDAARVCEVVAATPSFSPEIPEGVDLTNWQGITLYSNRSRCTETRLPTDVFYRYPRIGFSADGHFAIALVDSGTGAMAITGSRCYLQRDSDQWRLIGCTFEWEF